MKKLLTVLAGALTIAWIAVPVAGAADVYGHAKPGDVYASTHPDPWANSDGLRHPDPWASRDGQRLSVHPDPWLTTGLRPAADVYGSSWSSVRPHDVYQTSSWNRIHLRQIADVNERG
jgi:hypothetical protein